MQTQNASPLARLLILSFLCSTLLSACAHHEQYTMWYDKEQRRQIPTTAPRVAQAGEHAGQCVRDWEVTYVEKGQIRERTKRLSGNYTGTAVLGAGAAFSLLMAGSSTGDAAGLWGLTFIGTAIGAIGWGTYTLILDLTEASPTETEREVVKTETRKSDGCDAEPAVASVRPSESGECMKPALVARKLEQLDELKADGLVDDSEYDTEREALVDARCAEPASETASADPRERLHELARLKEDGLISENEYQRKRREILDTL